LRRKRQKGFRSAHGQQPLGGDQALAVRTMKANVFQRKPFCGHAGIRRQLPQHLLALTSGKIKISRKLTRIIPRPEFCAQPGRFHSGQRTRGGRGEIHFEQGAVKPGQYISVNPTQVGKQVEVIDGQPGVHPGDGSGNSLRLQGFFIQMAISQIADVQTADLAVEELGQAGCLGPDKVRRLIRRVV